MRVIVTDPCYILSNEAWDVLCKETDKEVKADWKQWSVVFREKVQKLLRKISKDHNALADDTGFGDWSNYMSAIDNTKVEQHDFVADSGMVCIVKDTPQLQEYLKQNDIVIPPLGCYAELKVPNDSVYEIDKTDPGWSVVRIKDVNGNQIAWSIEAGDDGDFI